MTSKDDFEKIKEEYIKKEYIEDARKFLQATGLAIEILSCFLINGDCLDFPVGSIPVKRRSDTLKEVVIEYTKKHRKEILEEAAKRCLHNIGYNDGWVTRTLDEIKESKE